MESLGAGVREEQFPILLPGMCLNRYYVAEGVRLYSQETWRLVMGDDGRMWTAKFAPQVPIACICPPDMPGSAVCTWQPVPASDVKWSPAYLYR